MSVLNGTWELGRRLREWQAEYRGTAWTMGAIAAIGLVVLLILI